MIGRRVDQTQIDPLLEHGASTRLWSSAWAVLIGCGRNDDEDERCRCGFKAILCLLTWNAGRCSGRPRLRRFNQGQGRTEVRRRVFRRDLVGIVGIAPYPP